MTIYCKVYHIYNCRGKHLGQFSSSSSLTDSEMMFLVRFAVFLVLLLSTVRSGRAENDIFQCPAHGPCRKAFLTSNPMTLKCGERPEGTHVSWQFLDAKDAYIEAVTFISSSEPVDLIEGLNTEQHLTISSLMSRAKLDSGDLIIKSPRVEDTGAYICKDGEKTLASYQIDFQDASHIYISHAGLMQNALLNTAIDLGEEVMLQMFTVWSDWQPCDRCRFPGERKRIGFCYGQVSKDAILLKGPLPCGLLRMTLKKVSFTRPPELRIETCREACTAIPSAEAIVIDNYHTLLHADVSFKCPESTIYKPVYWTYGRKSITRLQQMLNNTSYILDNTTGGGTLSIHMINETERGVFDCYVDRQLTGRFNVIFPDVTSRPVPEQYGVTEYVLMGLVLLIIAAVTLGTIRQCMKSMQCAIY